MRSKQELFDTIVSHLRKQGCKSVRYTAGINRVCLYRGPDDTKCAVGCLIPDELYDPKMETNGIRSILNHGFFKKNPELQHEFETHQYFLSMLQMIHDHEEVSDWEERFRTNAERFHVIYTPPEK